MEIVKEDLVREFVKKLPEITLKPTTVHLLGLALKAERMKELYNLDIRDTFIERKIIKPKQVWRSHFVDEVCNLAALQAYGTYRYRDQKLSSQVMAVVSTLEPRDVIGAVNDFIKESLDLAYLNNYSSLYALTKVSSRFFLHLLKRKRNMELRSIEISDPRLFENVYDILSLFPIVAVTRLSKRYHVIVDISSEDDKEEFYSYGVKEIKSIPDVQLLDYVIEPVPGTLWYEDNTVSYVELVE